MTPAPRLLALHSGGAKTGSSAVQSVLAAGAEILAAQGLAYRGGPGAEQARAIASGNGVPLLAALRTGTDAEVAALLDGHLGDLPQGIVSNEHFEGLPPEGWRRLLRLCATAGLRLRVVHVLRDPLPLLLSRYDQAIKRHGEARPLAAWAAGAAFPGGATLRALHGLGPAVDLRALHYESEGDRLVPAVLGALGADPGPLAGVVAGTGRLNRSLHPVERDLLRRVNAAFGDRHSRALSDRLLALAPDRPSRPEADPAAATLARRLLGEDAAWANATLFGGRPVLRLPEADDGPASDAKAPIGGDAGAAPDGDDAADARALVLDWALDRLAELAGRDPSLLAAHLLAVADRPRPADPRLPEDFDPVRYLLLHPLLLGARADPVRHYLARGRDQGLAYRSPPSPGGAA